MILVGLESLDFVRRVTLVAPLLGFFFTVVHATTCSAQRRCPRGYKAGEHVVARGETLSGIAAAEGVAAADVLEANPGLQPDVLAEGQKLRLCVPRRQTKQRAKQRAKRRTSPLCDHRTPIFEHTIVDGEWLAEIASRYGVRQRDLLRLNPKLRDNPDFLRAEHTLRVCPEIAPRTREKIIHTVHEGERLVTIAERYSLSLRQLLRFQRGALEDPDRLRVGQQLVVWHDGGIAPGFAEADEGAHGLLANGLQLPEGQHYVLKNARLAWGTPQTIRLIQTAAADYRRRARNGPPVFVGDISKKGGGHLPPHRSHRTGQDVDVGYVMKGAAAAVPRFHHANENNLDVAKTWTLIQAFLRTNQVRYIFMSYDIQALLYKHAKAHGTSENLLDELFQYPRGNKRAYGIIREEPGHVNHFHVRFR